MIFFLMQIVNGQPISKSSPIESETPPEIVPPFTDVWTEAEWLDFLAAQQPTEPPAPTFEQLMSVEQIDNYKLFREQLADVLELTTWDNCTGEQQVFCAKNLLGTAAQRASVLTDEPKQHLEFLLEKGVI